MRARKKVIMVQNIFIFIILFSAQTWAMDGVTMQLKCGDKPNCVSSYEIRQKFLIQPLINVEGPWAELRDKIKTNMFKISHSKVQAESENFIHFVSTTRILRFKDDVCFWWDKSSKTLNMKSESRLGYSDLGANRKRLNKFIQNWK